MVSSTVVPGGGNLPEIFFFFTQHAQCFFRVFRRFHHLSTYFRICCLPLLSFVPSSALLLFLFVCHRVRRVVSLEEGKAFAAKHGLLFMEMSARNAVQVERAFIGTAERVRDLL